MKLLSARAWRVGLKVLHELASMGFGGGLAACLVLHHVADGASAAEFAAARHTFAAIAQYLLLPSMAVVVLSGLLSLAATRGYIDAGWAWAKAALGISVFQATLMLANASRDAAAAVGGTDATLLEATLRSERITLWILMALSAVNVVLAVWRPRLTIKVR